MCFVLYAYGTYITHNLLYVHKIHQYNIITEFSQKRKQYRTEHCKFDCSIHRMAYSTYVVPQDTRLDKHTLKLARQHIYSTGAIK